MINRYGRYYRKIMRFTQNIITIWILFSSNIFGSTIHINQKLFDISVNEIGNDHTVIKYSFGEFQKTDVVINGETYSTLKLEEEVNIQEQGYPALPKIETLSSMSYIAPPFVWKVVIASALTTSLATVKWSW